MVKFAEFKKFFIFNLIGSLIISAIVAVITVLIGEVNEVTWRVFLTLAMVVSHSLVSLGFIWDDEKQNTFERLAFFVDVLFMLIVVSFVTSIFGIWKILPSDIVWKLYQTYFVIAFASLHADILSKVLRKETYIDWIIYSNYFFMAVLVCMLIPTIFINDATTVLGEMFFRIMGAVAIVDGTLSVLVIIFYKLYNYKHPKESNILANDQGLPGAKKKGLSFWVWLLIIYIVFQIILPIIIISSSFIFRATNSSPKTKGAGLTCICVDTSSKFVCMESTKNCGSGKDMDAICLNSCKNSGGVKSTSCLPNHPSCTR